MLASLPVALSRLVRSNTCSSIIHDDLLRPDPLFPSLFPTLLVPHVSSLPNAHAQQRANRVLAWPR